MAKPGVPCPTALPPCSGYPPAPAPTTSSHSVQCEEKAMEGHGGTPGQCHPGAPGPQCGSKP